jgi:hypothetical protein
MLPHHPSHLTSQQSETWSVACAREQQWHYTSQAVAINTRHTYSDGTLNNYDIQLDVFESASERRGADGIDARA